MTKKICASANVVIPLLYSRFNSLNACMKYHRNTHIFSIYTSILFVNGKYKHTSKFDYPDASSHAFSQKPFCLLTHASWIYPLSWPVYFPSCDVVSFPSMCLFYSIVVAINIAIRLASSQPPPSEMCSALGIWPRFSVKGSQFRQRCRALWTKPQTPGG